MAQIDTDYLIVGAGALGLSFADSLLDHSDAHLGLSRPFVFFAVLAIGTQADKFSVFFDCRGIVFFELKQESKLYVRLAILGIVLETTVPVVYSALMVAFVEQTYADIQVDAIVAHALHRFATVQ